MPQVPTATALPTVEDPGALRNVVLVGHTGAGKTTLVESLLVASGTISRAGKVEDGTTVSDFDEAEARQHRSVSLTLEPVTVGGVKVNLLDTPGYPDFVGEVRAGLRAADAALFVVSATEGLDGQTRVLWEECAAVGMPRAICINKVDAPRADIDEVVALCQRIFGAGVLPAYLPMHDDDGSVGGLIALLSQTVIDYTGAQPTTRPADPEHEPLVADARGALIEAIIAESEDETLMDRYLGGDALDIDMLIADMETAIARGRFYPVLVTSATTGLGAHEVLELLVSAFPPPADHPLPAVTTPDGIPKAPLTCDPAGPLVAEVVKTTTDPYLGRVSLVRVFSGTLSADMPVHVSGHGLASLGHADHDVDERVGALATPLGKLLRPVAAAVAGDIVSVAKLSHAETGDTLSAKDDPALIAAWTMPEPLLPVAITARSKADEDKLATGLARLVAEDPTLRLVADQETGQLVLWVIGEAHAEMCLERLRNRYGASVDTVPVRIPLRETFLGTATGHGRHVKQSGGHGQFAICDIVVEPGEPGSGLTFVDEVVGGAVPRQFIPSVEKGIATQMERGVLAGYPIVDIRVRLVDGKAHSVDSSDMAFQMAGALALKDAAAAGQPTLLEPVLDIAVTVPDEYVGPVMGDVSGRRGRVAGTEPTGEGWTTIRAEIPEVEVARYAVELRQLSQGTGSFSRRYLRHEPMPANLVAAEVAAAAKAGS